MKKRKYFKVRDFKNGTWDVSYKENDYITGSPFLFTSKEEAVDFKKNIMASGKNADFKRWFTTDFID